MKLNSDLTRPVIVEAAALDWVPSPAAGVDRKMLYREGDEVARATSIVRYAPGSAFPEHSHTGGEEILVLEGVFQDEHGDYPAGCYFRNPPGTAHSPASAQGCTIFVRLWQYRTGDAVQIVRQPDTGPALGARAGVRAARLLFEDHAERVTLEDWGGAVHLDNRRGTELLVLSGEVALTLGDKTQRLGPQGWARVPAGQNLKALPLSSEGARLWLKEAPLQHPDVLPMPGEG